MIINDLKKKYTCQKGTDRTGMEQNGLRAGANMAAMQLHSFVTSPFILTFF